MNKKGVALVFSFIVIVVLLVLGASMLSRSISESRLAKRYEESTQAFWLAEAGIQRTLRDLNDGDWSAWSDQSGNKVLSPQTLGIGQYEVVVIDPTGSSPGITAIGYVPTKSAWRAQRVIEATGEAETSSPFNYAAFGKVSLTMSGNNAYTDSYDSSKGGYNQVIDGVLNKGLIGHVGTNGTTTGILNIGNADVGGNVSTGPSGTVAVGPNGSYIGTPTHANDVSLPSVVVPTSLTGLSSSGSISMNNWKDDTTLPAGNYKYSSMDLSGGTLTITGTVNIYLTESSSNALSITGQGKVLVASGAKVTIYTAGKCNIAGQGVVNNTALPTNCFLYSTYSGTGDGVSISGGSALYGAVYAPDATIAVPGDAGVYGSLIGKTVNASGNGAVHYDEALKNVGGGGSATYSLQGWKEQQNPYPLGS